MPKPQPYTRKDGGTSYRVRVRDARGKQTSETFHGLPGKGGDRVARQQAERFCRLVDAIGAPAALAQRDREDRAHADYVPTLREWLPQHIDQLTGVTDRTRLDYAAMAARTWLPIIGDLPLDGIDRAAISKTVNALERQGLSSKSIRNAHGLLSAVMASAVLADHIGTNPCHRMRLPRAGEVDKVRPRFLTHAEYERLRAAIDPRHRLMLETMFQTGLRWSELTALTVADVRAPVPPSAHNPRGVPPFLRVDKAWKATPGRAMVIGPPKSRKSRRDVTIAQVTYDALTPLLDRPGLDRLFTAPRGGPIYHGWWRARFWVPACIEAGLAAPKVEGKPYVYDGPRIHDARHTYASWLIEQGVPLELVQDMLGHESILTTRAVYGDLQPAMRLTVADAVGRAVTMGAPPAELEGR